MILFMLGGALEKVLVMGRILHGAVKGQFSKFEDPNAVA